MSEPRYGQPEQSNPSQPNPNPYPNPYPDPYGNAYQGPYQPHSYQPNPYQPLPHPPGPPRSSAESDSALVFGIVGLVLSAFGIFIPLVCFAGLVLSIIGLRKARRTGVTPVMAIIGIALGGLLSLITVGGVVFYLLVLVQAAAG